jgi:hypothetical protein
MNRSATIDPVAMTAGRDARHPHARCPRRNAIDWQGLAQRQFLAIEQALAQHGGLMTGEDLTLRLRARSEQPLSIVARWIVSRQIISIAWQAQTLIPVFQFSADDLSLRACVSAATAELAPVFDDWELLSWFTQPNCWLQDAAPVAMLDVDALAVSRAARADRFIARG